MSIIRKIPWIRQPGRSSVGINRANPISLGLTHVLFLENNNVVAELSGSQLPNTNTGSVGVDGYNIGTSDVLGYTRPLASMNNVGTALINFESNGNTPVGNGKFFITTDTDLQLYRGGGDTVLIFGLGGQDVTFTGLADIWDQTEHQLAAVWDNALPERNISVDGIWETANTTTWTSSSDTTDLHFLNRADAIRSVQGKIRYGLFWNRVLPRSEIASVQAKPHQLILPRTQIIPIEIAAAGATPKYPLGLPLYGPFRGPIG